MSQNFVALKAHAERTLTGIKPWRLVGWLDCWTVHLSFIQFTSDLSNVFTYFYCSLNKWKNYSVLMVDHVTCSLFYKNATYLFKIPESLISFCLKFFSDSAILNRWKFFSRMINHISSPPWGLYFSNKWTWSELEWKHI